jgi:predicted amidophosphoribosyltransferase
VTGCPVCRAAFRGVAICPRCGADLAPLMRVAARSWRLRHLAREALSAGDFDSARRRAEEAQALQSTREGRAIAAISRAIAQAR